MKNEILQGDCLTELKKLKSESIDCVITSPPYWGLRDYGMEGQLGLEPTFQEYINKLCDIFDEVKRVLKKEGTCWVNMGDTYGGSWQNYGAREGKQRRKNTRSFNREGNPKERIPPSAYLPGKSLIQIPSRFAIEMTDRSWILRNEIIWHKPNCMPSSADDRFTVDFEKIFFFVKNKKYWFEQQNEDATYTDNRKDMGNIRYKGRHTPVGVTVSDHRNKRTVWTITTKPYKEAHFATFPEALIEPMIKAGCPEGGTVLDPFMGSGTTAFVAKRLKRKWLGIELNPEYIKIAEQRIKSIPEPLL